MNNARFIVLEGPDGAGTTYHSRKLAQALQAAGEAVLLTSEPSRGRIGSFIQECIKESSDTLPAAALQLLFCADRAHHLATVIEPALQEGATVICDRYVPSTIVYGVAQGLEAGWLADINRNFREPDEILLLLPPLDVCRERLKRRAESDIFENEAFQRRVFGEYERFAKEHPSVKVIDTRGEKEAVSEQILGLAS